MCIQKVVGSLLRRTDPKPAELRIIYRGLRTFYCEIVWKLIGLQTEYHMYVFPFYYLPYDGVSIQTQNVKKIRIKYSKRKGGKNIYISLN